MKILLVAKQNSERGKKIFDHFSKNIKYDFTLNLEDKELFFKDKDKYDVIHFVDFSLVKKWDYVPHMVNLFTIEDYNYYKLRKCLRIITNNHDIAKRLHIKYILYNCQTIPELSFDNYGNEKVHGAYEHLYTQIGMEAKNTGCVMTNKEYDNLIVTFGGLGKRFNFWNILNNLKTKKLFVRDQYNFWYNHGIDEIYNTPEKVADMLQKSIDKHSVFLGDSAGGYASLLIGHYAKPDYVLAFDPQTFIDKDLRDKHNDHRWPFFADPTLKKYEGVDLKEVLRNYNGKTKYYIIYSIHHEIDSIHAERLKDIDGVTLVPIDSIFHGVAGELKKMGLLENMLKEVCEDNKLDIINKLCQQFH